MAIVALLAMVIAGVVVDALTKSCTAEESEGDRVQRLFCDGALNVTEDGDVVPGQAFACQAPDADLDNLEEEWFENPDMAGQCIEDSSCLSTGFDSVLTWISDNPGLGWLVTAVVYALLTILLIPGSVLTIGSGVAFGTALGLGKGVLVGTTAVIVGAVAGATVAFIMGRFLAKELLEMWSDKFKLIKALDRALEEQGFKVVLLLRLSPVVPFNVFNFIMGSTSCTLKNYFMATVIGIIPGSTAFVFIGALVGAAAFDSSSDDSDGSFVDLSACEDDPKEATVRLIVLIVGALASVLAVVLISVYARKQFRILQADLEADDAQRADDEDTEDTDRLTP